ncbi:ESPR-type extended signal peptide-containing protein [Acinetobacter sp. WZC-1]|uniref:ESPR-type extended signal peptide-containing protein n=1 Tax=Acinetobacter sp. WZC-1 TaxID=3459034 RepID=UPI00403E1D8C
MNKIYKVIWSTTLGAWVAVSEMAKTKTRSTTKSVKVSAVAGVVGMISFAPGAFAASGIDGGAASGGGTAISSCTTASTQASTSNDRAIAIGCGTTTTGINTSLIDRGNPANNSTTTGNVAGVAFNGSPNTLASGGGVAIGTGATAGTPTTIALGTQAKAIGGSSVVIGGTAVATGETALAIGRQSAATGNYAQALGNVSVATGPGTLAIGHSATASGDRAIAIGAPNTLNTPTYQSVGQTAATAADSIAFGGAAQATANNAIALGSKASATIDNSVALGAGSVTSALTGNSYLTNQAAPTSKGSVAVGDRRIQNVADGAAAQDAVTVSQLTVVKNTADAAQTTANTAVTNAATAQTTANTAVTNAAAAQTTANTAVTNAATAQTTANTAVTKADTAQATADRGLNFRANTGTADNLKLGETVTLADGSNTTVSYDAATNTYKYNVVDAPVFAGQVKANGFDANNQKVINVANGTVAANSKDAVNGGQLNTTNQNVTTAQNAANAAQTTANTAGTKADAAQTTANTAVTNAATADGKAVAAQATADKGLNFSANGGTADNVKLGETVNFADGTNSKAVYDAATNTYKYNVVDAPVFAGQVKANGFDANNQKVINVANGTVAANSKDAVNGGQLNTTNQNVTTAQNAANAAQTTANTAGTKADAAQTTANTAVTNAATADGKAVAAQTAANTAQATADKGLNFSANGGTADNVKLGETVNFADGTNSKAVYDAATNTYKYNVVDAPVFAGQVKANGFDANNQKVVNVADGTVAANSKDAVNGGQLNTTNQNVTTAQNAANAAQTTANTAGTKADAAQTTANTAVTNAATADGKAVAAQATADKGLNFSANGGTADNVKLGETVNFADGTNTKAVYDPATNSYKYNVVDAPVFAGQVKANGFDANNQKVVNVADGVDGKDAVNKGQLDAANQAGGAKTDALGNSTAANLGGGSGYDPVTGTVTAPSYVTTDPTTGTSKTSDNVGDALSSLNTAVNKPLTFKDAGTGSSVNPLGSEFAIVGDSNLTSTVEQGKATLTLNKDLKGLNSVETVDADGNSVVTDGKGTTVTGADGKLTTLTADGTTVTDGTDTSVYGPDGLNVNDGAVTVGKDGLNAGGVTVSKDGINANGTGISNVKDGVDGKDAVNKGQLDAANQAGGAKTDALGNSTAANLGGGSGYDPVTGAITAPSYVTTDPTTGTSKTSDNVGDALSSLNTAVNKPLTFKDAGTGSSVNPLGSEFAIVGDSNLTSTVEQGKATLTLNKDLKGLNSVETVDADGNSVVTDGKGTTVTGADGKLTTLTADGTTVTDGTDTSVYGPDGLNVNDGAVTVGKDGLNAGGVTVSKDGINANGTGISNVKDGVDGKDAVNKGQLDAANQAGGAKTDALGNSTAANLGGGSGYDPVTGAITAPSYVTTDPTTGTSKTSDNVGDALSSLNTAVNKPLTFKDAGTGSSVNPLGSEFAIVGDSNLTSTVEQGKATLTLNKDLKGLNSVETVDADGNSVVTDGKGTTVTGADGKLTTLTADGTTVTDGTDTSVYGPDGLNVNDGAVTVGKDGLNAGGVTVSKDGINANGTGISNVKDGVDGKDAVNKGQLDAANQAGGAKTDALGNSTAANLGGGSGYDPVTGAITAPSYVTTDPTTGTSKTSDNVGDALSSLNTAVNKPLTFKDAGTGSSVNPLGSEFAIVGDSNLTSTVEQGKATLTLNKDLKGLNSVETVDADGNSVVTDGKGTTVTGADGKLTTLTADGTTVTDGTNTSVYGPDGLNVNDGAVTVGRDGLNAGGVTVSKDGINANGTGISNVKDGVDGKDAVNKGQLDAANQAGGAKTDALGNSTAANLGGGSGYDPVTGAITAPSYVTTDPTTGTSKTSDNVGDALSSLNTAVNKPLTFKDAGTGSSVNPLGSEFAIVGDSNLTTTVSQGQAAIALNKDLKGLNSVETVDADGNSVVTDGKGTTVTGADGKLTTLTADGTTVTDGTNTSVYGPDGLNVNDGAVTVGKDGLNAGGVTVSKDGINANGTGISNVKDGVDGKDAVNKGQLDAANQAGGAKTDALGNSTAANLGGGSGYDPVTGAITAPSYVTTDPTTGTSKTSDNVGDALSSLNTAVNKPLTFKDAGTGSSVNPLGSEFAIVGDSNLTSTVEQGKATLTLNKDLKGLNSVETVDADGNSVVTDGKGTTVTGADGKLTTLTADGTTVTDGTNTSVYGPDGLNVNDGAVTVGRDGLNAGGVTVSKDGINANGTGISNVKDGVDGKDAVNKGQLDAANQAGGAKTDALGNSTAANLGGGSGYDPVTGAITAPSYVTTDPTTGTSKTSDNVGDALSSLNTAVNKPLTFKDAGTGSSVNPLGSEFAIVGDSNLTTTVSQGQAAIALNKDLKGLNSVETVDADGNSVVTDGKGTTVTGADGKLTTLTADGTTVTDGTNTSVYGPDGLNVNDGAVTVGRDGLNAGGVTVSKDGINANGTGISNVKDGVDGKDAVNKGQLDAANQAGGAKTDALGNSTAANLGGGSGYDPVTGAITAPSYVTTDPTTGTSKTSDNVGDALSSLNTAVNKPLTFKDAGTGSSVNPLGSEFAIVGDSNLTSTVEQGKATLTLNKDLKGLNSVETVDADGNSVVTDGKGTTVTGADGKLTTLTADGTTVTDGTNTSVYGPDGLNVNDGAVTVGKDGLNAGGVTVSKDGINANGTGISNVKDGVDGKDAVNKGQLDAANQAGGAKTDALGNSTAANLGGGSGYDPVTGAITAPSYVTTDPTTGTSKTSDNVGDALSSLNTAVNKPLTFKDAGTGSSVNPLGSEFAIVGDSNLTTTVSQGQAAIALNKDLKGLNSVETVDADGNSVLTDGKGTTVTGADGKLTTLTADGTTVTDGTDTSVYGPNGLSVNDGAVTVGKDGLNAGGVTVSKDGINANGTGISNVKDGVDGKDAVNKGQLDAANQAGGAKTDALGNSTAANLGGGSGYDPVTGAITAPSYVTTDPTTGTSKTSDNVGDALSSLNTAVNKPLTFKDAGTGSSVNPLGSEFAIVGDSNLTSTVEQGKATLTLNKDLKGLNSVETVDADGNSVVTDGKGTTVTGADGKLTTLTADGTTVTDGTDTSVYGANGLNVNDGAVTVGRDGLNAGGVTVSKDGINANGTGISNVKDGVDGKDAVNVDQLTAVSKAGSDKSDALGNSTAANLGGGAEYDRNTGTVSAPSYTVTSNPNDAGSTTAVNNVGDAISSLNTAVNQPLTFKDAGTGSSVNPLGSEFAIVGDSNLTTTVSQGQAAIALNKDITVDSVTAGASRLDDNGLAISGGPSVTKGGINAANTRVSNVADGVDTSDAVNKGQLDTAISGVNSNVNNLANNAVQYDKNADGTVNKDSIILGGGADGTKISNVANGQVEAGSRDAINGGQLANVRDNLQGQITNNANDISNIKNDINSGSVGLVRQAGPNAEVTVAKDTGGKSVSVAGTDGERTVTGVANGAVNSTSKDAVNGSQLNATNEAVVNYLGGGAGYNNITESFTAPSYAVGTGTYNNVGGAIDALNQADQTLNTKIDNVSNRLDDAFRSTNHRINDVERKANAGIAAAMAMESAPYIPGKYTYSAGAAYHGGENAVGVTLRKTADNGRWSLTGGVAAASQGDPSVRIGISGVID